MLAKRRKPLAVFASLAVLAALAATSAASAGPVTCFGSPVTITAVPGVTTHGTAGPDVIMGTSGDDVIITHGGADLVCSRGGDDDVRGGGGNDKINLGKGDDVARGGPGNDLIQGKGGSDLIRGNKGADDLRGGRGADDLRGGPGSDKLRGNKGRDRLNGGAGNDSCKGGTGKDTRKRCGSQQSPSANLNDTFAGSGKLLGYTTNNAFAIPNVGRSNGRYRAEVLTNANNVTLHFNEEQGRLDAKLVSFPFDITVRNLGIGTQADSQTAPSPTNGNYIFAGVQVHVPNLDDTNSAHVVVGHRGGTPFTIEGKNTRNGSSSVNDAGPNIVPDGRADIRIVGNADRTLTVYWQTPNANPDKTDDNWTLYNGDGRLPGAAPTFGKTVYIGLITYAFGSANVPFVGTADSIESN